MDRRAIDWAGVAMILLLSAANAQADTTIVVAADGSGQFTKVQEAIMSVPDPETVAAIRLLAETEGIFTETAGGVTLAALQRAIAEGHVDRTDEVVLVITGNGLKTLDVLAEGLAASVPEPIAPTLTAFEAWWEAEAARAA